jgi:hypothetical protein
MRKRRACSSHRTDDDESPWGAQRLEGNGLPILLGSFGYYLKADVPPWWRQVGQRDDVGCGTRIPFLQRLRDTPEGCENTCTVTSGQVFEPVDVLARYDHRAVDSGSADDYDVAVYFLRGLTGGTDVKDELRNETAMTVDSQGTSAGY